MAKKQTYVEPKEVKLFKIPGWGPTSENKEYDAWKKTEKEVYKSMKKRGFKKKRPIIG